MRSTADEGSGSIWVLTVAMVLLLATVVVGAMAQAERARVRAASAADAAALAGAARVLEGEQAACDAARQLARDNDAELVTCTLDGGDVQVIAEVALGGALAAIGPARAAARATLYGIGDSEGVSRAR